jgi:ATP-dependent DNA helicase RecQ
LQDVVLQRSRIEDSVAPEEQKRLEAQKLNALLAYAESPRCRRVVLLDYFGEASEPCNNCDVCLTPPELWDGTVAAQKALSVVYRTGQRFGVVHLIDVLRGKVSDKVKQWGHDALPTFGVGADLDDGAWRAVFRQLVAGGMLTADLAEHGAMKLTDAARPVLRGEQTLQMRRHVARKGGSSGGSKSRSERAPTKLDDMTLEDQSLFEDLRQWRAATAKEQGVPAYVILHDKTLKELAEERPTTRDQLMNISGMGTAKLERYGDDLLGIIRAA